MPTPLMHPGSEDFNLFQIMGALADPVRLGIVVTLASRSDLSCNGFYPDLTPSVLTRHFRILREVGLIRQRDVGTRRVNVLRRDELDTRFPGLLDLVVKEGADYLIPDFGVAVAQ
ncbi:helix-turn-helix domain-containing protein [Rhodococcus sp. T2V]|uniref:ArsR/SmtB family transcription factor n=1 Tax=Rhodococcus sp. T2V TaxID=3034164 RepID=UPI0023E2EEC1|nr:helix-turn-helix domain-containing protein [Rhodococcus sp. T2V]MDF3311153.1 helix-turn-helix domain-containing protein [Rhodococcus sp. T2V]